MEITYTHWVIVYALQILSILSVWVLAFKYIRLRKVRENEHYTDYTRGNLVLRIYKPEFEYQAIGEVPRGKLLDQGVFSQYYMWALIEK